MSCDVWPHFQGGYGDYFYLGPNHAIFRIPDEITDGMAAGINCAFTQVYAALDIAGSRPGGRSRSRAPGASASTPAPSPARWAPASIIVIDGVEERLELAKDFGADELVDMRECPTPAERIERVIELTERLGRPTWSWSWSGTPTSSTRGSG